MERIRELDRYQKGILLLLVVMIVVFGVIYSSVSSRVGYLYYDVILQYSEDDGNSVYAGTIDYQECRFTVTADQAVTFQCGDKTYGPYTAKEDPTARPGSKNYLTGVEILEGDSVFFRGGVYRSGDELMLFDEAGEFIFDMMITGGDGITMDENGNIIDPMAPSPATVLELMAGPELTSKGEWIAYLGGILISVIAAVSILFADEMFRFSMVFRVQDVSRVEPADWEIAGRYIGWTVLTVAAFAIYIIGLQ